MYVLFKNLHNFYKSGLYHGTNVKNYVINGHIDHSKFKY